MPVLASDLVAETVLSLESGQRVEANRLNGALTSGATSIPFIYDLGAIQKGAVISIDLERIRVWEVSTASKTASVVERGVEGTTAASHSTLARVDVNAKFDSFRVLQTINEDIADLSSPLNGMFQMKGLNVAYSAAVSGYDLTSVTDLIEVYELRYEAAGSSKYWPTISEWDVSRSMDTTEFASGQALFLYQTAQPGSNIRVRYKGHYGQLATLADALTTTTGLPERAKDIPILGAQARLVALREPRRGDYSAEGNPRRAEEVPPGTQLNSAAALLRLRERRIQAEAALLLSQFPPRRRT